MTTVNRKKRIRFRLPILPSAIMVILAFLVWQLGENGMAYWPWLCAASVLISSRHIVNEAKLPSLYTWFNMAYIGLFLIYPIVSPLTNIPLPTTNEVFVDYCFLVVCGLHLFIAGYETASPSGSLRGWRDQYSTTSQRLFNAICLLLLLNLVASMLVIIDAGSFSAIRGRTRDDMKFDAGLLSMAGIYLYLIGVIMYPLLGVYMRRGKHRIIVWLPIVVLLEIFIFLMFRVRTFPVMHALGLLVGWFLIAPRMTILHSRPRRSLRLNLSTTQKVSILGLVFCLVLGMFVLRVFRGNFEKADSLSEIEIDVAASVQYAFEGGGELGYSKWVFKILEVVPSQHDYLYGQSYYRLLFVPIPRSLWPEKPLNSQRIVAQWIDPGVVSIQTSPVGIIGDLYVNFGPWGILGMFVFGLAFGRFDRGVELKHALFLAISFAMVFHLVRGAFTNPILEMIVSFVVTTRISGYLQRVGTVTEEQTRGQLAESSPPLPPKI